MNGPPIGRGAPPSTLGRPTGREIREALDEGRPVPDRAGPHDVAATLLAFFAALPATFMPHAAAQVCDVCVPSVSAPCRFSFKDPLRVFAHRHRLRERLHVCVAASHQLDAATGSGAASCVHCHGA